MKNWGDIMKEVAAQVVTDEPVLGAGVFEPPAAIAAGVATLHGAGGLGFTKHMEFDGVPQNCLIAVTATKVHLISVKAMGSSLKGAPVTDPELFATIDRDHLEVSFHLRKMLPSTLLLHDLASEKNYHLVGYEPKHDVGSAKYVFAALADVATND